MTTIQQFLLEQSGSSIGKEKRSLPISYIKVDGDKYPVFPEKPGAFQAGKWRESTQSAVELAKNQEGGFLYPFYAGFGENVIGRVGEMIELPNGLSVPYLPFCSVVARVEQIDHLDGNHFKLLMPLEGIDDFSIVVCAEKKDGGEGITFQVSTANYSQEDFDEKSYVKEMYPKGYNFFQIEKMNFGRSYSDFFIVGKENKKLNSKNLQRVEGKTIVAGLSPYRDYFFCDFTFETGPYTWPSANYSQDGNLIMDAIYLPG